MSTGEKLPHRHIRRTLAAVTAVGALSVVMVPSFGANASVKPTVKHASKPLVTVQLGLGAPIGAGDYPVLYATAIGLWYRYGLNVVTQTAASAAALAAGLYSNSVNLDFGGTPNLTEAVLTHQVTLVGAYSELYYDLVASPLAHLSPIKKVSQLSELNGLTLGLTSPGSISYTVMAELQHSAHSTMEFYYEGSVNPLAVLQSGDVNVTVATASQLGPLEAAGMQVIGNLDQLTNGRGLYTTVAANRLWLRTHAHVAQEFAMAIRQAIADAKKDPTAAIQALANAVPETTSEAQVAFDLQKSEVFFKPLPLTELRYDLNTIVSTTPAAATTRYGTVLDNGVIFNSNGTIK